MQLVVLTGLVSASLRCAALVDRVVQVLATASTLLDTIDTQETLQGATPTYRSADETKAFVLTVRSLARAKRRSSKKSSGGYLDSFMSRLFFFSDEPLDQHAASVADNFELRVDDLLLDEDDDVASAQHMHPLSDASLVSFCHAAWTEIERVVLPPAKSKACTVPKLSPGGAVFLEQLVLQVLGKASPSSLEMAADRLWSHAEVVLSCADPFIRGNLQVQDMAFENAVFLVDTLVTGLTTLGESKRLGLLLQLHQYVLLGPVTHAVLRGLVNMPPHMEHVHWVQLLAPVQQPAWIPDVMELLDKWMRTLLLVDVADQLDVTALINVVFTWGVFPVQAEAAAAAQALKYAVQLFHHQSTTPLVALSIVGGVLALRCHPTAAVRANSTLALAQCLLEAPLSSSSGTCHRLDPETWSLVLRFGCQRERGVDVPTLFLLQALTWHMSVHYEVALELLRNVVQVVSVSCDQPWIQSTVQAITAQYPDVALLPPHHSQPPPPSSE
ncbi:hypothetical protein DYB28_001200 [Aphanomyces astaci]|uniref:Telomere length regulation protein conserved domain-containing protein n=1 Tax=Aphanomyces astaci TaxID=112090 RepID=A0A9X8EB89_APHAT|nr:hypothetical protein DYB28_001200 [Aphanomyces astaci]